MCVCVWHTSFLRSSFAVSGSGLNSLLDLALAFLRLVGLGAVSSGVERLRAFRLFRGVAVLWLRHIECKTSGLQGLIQKPEHFLYFIFCRGHD